VQFSPVPADDEDAVPHPSRARGPHGQVFVRGVVGRWVGSHALNAEVFPIPYSLFPIPCRGPRRALLARRGGCSLFFCIDAPSRGILSELSFLAMPARRSSPPAKRAQSDQTRNASEPEPPILDHRKRSSCLQQIVTR
jgi:hypothetical protein